MNWLGFTTGKSFFDVWSLVHLAFWVFVGSSLHSFMINKWIALASCLVVAFGWEVFEHFIAPAHPTIWKDPESWWNAWISDPLMCGIGVLGIWLLLDGRPR